MYNINYYIPRLILLSQALLMVTNRLLFPAVGNIWAHVGWEVTNTFTVNCNFQIFVSKIISCTHWSIWMHVRFVKPKACLFVVPQLEDELSSYNTTSLLTGIVSLDKIEGDNCCVMRVYFRFVVILLKGCNIFPLYSQNMMSHSYYTILRGIPEIYTSMLGVKWPLLRGQNYF